MISTSDRIDCVVIGYNDLPMDGVLESAEASQKRSPVWNEMLRSTARFRGERLPYMDVLNACLEEATGEKHEYHVCKLPALGVSYLTSFLRKRGHRSESIQFYSAEKDYLDQLLAQNPRSVAITTTFYVEADPINDIVARVRAAAPDTKIIVGGPHIYNVCESLDPASQDFVLGSIEADIFVFDSQGETTLDRVVTELKSDNPDLAGIPNLIYRGGESKFTHTVREVEDNDMDSNVIDWSYFDDSSFTPTAQLRSARSCAFECAFCRYPAVGGALTLNSVDVVEAQLKELSASGVKQVVFIDDTFNVPLPRFKDLCRMIIRNKFSMEFYSYFRCSNSDLEAFDLMAEAGFKGTFLGIESGDQGVLNNMNKHAKIEKYTEGIGNLRERGICTHASFIVGYPGETEETISNTIQFINEAKPTFFNAGVFYYDVKAPVAGMAEKFGLKGGGFNWRHATMDWKTAVLQSDRIYREVTNSTILPTHMFDFWGIPYLVGQGLSIDQLEGFAKRARPMLLAGLDDPHSDQPELEQELISFFRDSVGSGKG
ncbi:MAG: radical SAM PhpK family P-methyltransferase [Planctomycetota bacterium]|jgi:radical SAM PhpK family P-methyltransferase